MPMERERGTRNRGDQFENERWREYQSQDNSYEDSRAWQDDDYYGSARMDDRRRQAGSDYDSRSRPAYGDDDRRESRSNRFGRSDDDYQRGHGGSRNHQNDQWSQPGWMDERERHEYRRYGGQNVYGDRGRDRPGTNYYRPDYWSGAGGYAGGGYWPDDSGAGTNYGGGRSGYRGEYRGQGGRERGFFERAGDEIASWFGDDDAERRRNRDHRGRGPKNYTRSDDRIREDVSDCLSDDSHLDASEIEVSCKNGEVTLDGTVEERFAKRHAEDLAETVSGIKHVQNNLRISQDRTTGSQSGSTKSDESAAKGNNGSRINS
jgi:osmotically-inducible protein OsmY